MSFCKRVVIYHFSLGTYCNLLLQATASENLVTKKRKKEEEKRISLSMTTRKHITTR
jgi:hypothetical protein